MQQTLCQPRRTRFLWGRPRVRWGEPGPRRSRHGLSCLLPATVPGKGLALARLAAMVGVGLGLAGPASAQSDTQGELATFDITVENTNTGQNFSPVALVLHDESFALFTVGEPASAAVWRVAEDGATMEIQKLRDSEATVFDVVIGPSVHRRNSPVAEFAFDAPPEALLSFVSMLTVTNDGFVGLRGVPLPQTPGAPVSFVLEAYDSGTEANTESCAHVPCEAHGQRMTDGAEGTVQPHPGIRGDADISSRRDWTGQRLGTVTVSRRP